MNDRQRRPAQFYDILCDQASTSSKVGILPVRPSLHFHLGSLRRTLTKVVKCEKLWANPDFPSEVFEKFILINWSRWRPLFLARLQVIHVDWLEFQIVGEDCFFFSGETQTWKCKNKEVWMAGLVGKSESWQLASDPHPHYMMAQPGNAWNKAQIAQVCKVCKHN